VLLGFGAEVGIAALAAMALVGAAIALTMGHAQE